MGQKKTLFMETTSVPAHVTAGELSSLLIRAGALFDLARVEVREVAH